MTLVRTADRDGVRTVTLADVERRNVLSAELVGELVAALDLAEADPAVRVIVLTNEGSTFCAGADMAARGESRAAALDPTRLFGRFARSPKPYVGRIAGHCVAGGMGLMAALDISVAPLSARFGFTEVRVGVAPAIISVVCLPKMRRGDAQAAFLRGSRFPATEAVTLGLLTYAVPDEDLDATVDQVVDDLLRGGPQALAATKELLEVVPTLDRDAAFAFATRRSAELFASEEAKEGMAAFLARRPAPWAPPVGEAGSP